MKYTDEDVRALVEMVRELQWSAGDQYTDSYCSRCVMSPSEGHSDDCDLGKALKPFQEKP